jgi:O-antigen ligase
LPHLPLIAWIGISALPLLLVLTLRFPAAALIGIFTLVPFNQGLIGAEGTSDVKICASDVLATLSLASLLVVLFRERGLRAGPTGLAITLFLAIVTACTFLSPGLVAGNHAVVSLIRMTFNTLVPLLLFANVDRRVSVARSCFLGFLIGCNALSLWVILEFARGGFQAAMVTGGLNKNFMGPVLGCAVGVSLIALSVGRHRQTPGVRFWLILTLVFAAVAQVFTLSRGAWIATAGGLFIAFVAMYDARAFLAVVLTLTPLIAAAWQFVPKEASELVTEVSTDKAESNVYSRLQAMQYTMEWFKRFPVFGVGVGLRKIVEPHNIVVTTLGESGSVGLAFLLMMFASGFRTLFRAKRFAGHDPAAGQVIMACALVFSISILHGLADVYWRRGAGFLGWACVGLAMNFIPVHRPVRRRGFTPIARRGPQVAVAAAGVDE